MGGRIHVEWDPAAAVRPLGQLPFFIEFLKVSGLFEAWVADCPLVYESNRASDKRAVLATFLLSILAGHHRYAHITAIRNDGVHPELLGVEDAARGALARMDECAGVAWLDAHRAKTTQPLLATPWILDLDTTVKCLYGKQEGALVGYKPEEAGASFAQLSQRVDGATRQRPRTSSAISSRPLLLHGVATQTQHAGQKRLTITSTPAKQAVIQAVLRNLACFPSSLKAIAEQLTDAQRLRAILTRAFAKFMLATTSPPALLTAQIDAI